MTRIRGLDMVALVLVVIGGLNWGLIGLFNFDLVEAIFGDMALISRIVYVLVGISAVYAAVRSPHFAHLTRRGRAETPKTA